MWRRAIAVAAGAFGALLARGGIVLLHRAYDLEIGKLRIALILQE